MAAKSSKEESHAMIFVFDMSGSSFKFSLLLGNEFILIEWIHVAASSYSHSSEILS